ncbi:hypothetical protein [Leptothoe spongobia]|uniref:Tetratricopeptide repeat protein n=1 Tax=Leptothoe spongobia TAU-MAC 1115 TaxID=1967444 RepID=A0A947DCX0_9CYAN|nr:hypothetical protein [Leptothoe spongobia]MBT9314655.1 hypothetical protein [Leptothoe spongobia TAU-MAC 1115]
MHRQLRLKQSTGFFMGRDRIIENYIQRLLDWEEPVTADTLNALAEEVGLGPDDIAAIKQTAQNHLERGRSYLEFNCFDEAIEELTQATSLDPLDFEILQTLTYAYDQRYGKERNIADKKQAIALAKRCLELNPNDAESVILISSRETEANKSQLLIGLGLAVLVGFGVFRPVMNYISTQAEIRQLTEAAITPDPAPASDSPSTLNSDIPIAETGTTTSEIPPEIDIPITFDYEGLTLDSRLSRLDNYKDSSYYTLQGVLLNISDQEIDALRLNVEYLDKDGTVLEVDSKEAIGDSDASVRPGDYHAFDLIHKTTPDLANIRLSVVTSDQVPAPATYTPAPKIKYNWGGKPPTQLTFDLTARSENLDVYDITDSAYFNAEWAVTNTGDTAIRQLKLQVDFFNKQNQLILSKDVLAVYGSDAPMLSGEVRPVRVITSIDLDYGRYEVTVLEAE